MLTIAFRSLQIGKFSREDTPRPPFKARAFGTCNNAPPPPIPKNLATALLYKDVKLGNEWSTSVVLTNFFSKKIFQDVSFFSAPPSGYRSLGKLSTSYLRDHVYLPPCWHQL